MQGRKGRPLHERALEVIRRNPSGIEQRQLRRRLDCRKDDLEAAIAFLWSNGDENCAIRLMGDAAFPDEQRVEIYPAHIQPIPKRPLFQGKQAQPAIKKWVDPAIAGTWKQPDHVPLVFSPDWEDGHWNRKRGKAS